MLSFAAPPSSDRHRWQDTHPQQQQQQQQEGMATQASSSSDTKVPSASDEGMTASSGSGVASISISISSSGVSSRPAPSSVEKRAKKKKQDAGDINIDVDSDDDEDGGSEARADSKGSTPRSSKKRKTLMLSHEQRTFRLEVARLHLSKNYHMKTTAFSHRKKIYLYREHQQQEAEQETQQQQEQQQQQQEQATLQKEAQKQQQPQQQQQQARSKQPGKQKAAAAQEKDHVEVWGAMCWWGKVGPIFIETGGARFNANMYISRILMPGVRHLNAMFQLNHQKQWWFQQDADSVHTAKATQAWLEKFTPEFYRKDEWPSSSPDLNLMKTVWDKIEARVNEKKCQTVEALKRAIVEEWNEVSLAELRQLIEAWPQRLKQVIENDGDLPKA